MTAQLAPLAALDLAAYLDDVEADDPVTAHREAVRMHDALTRLAERTERGRVDRIRGVRRAVRSFRIPPMRASCDADEQAVFVLRLDHPARRPITR